MLHNNKYKVGDKAYLATPEGITQVIITETRRTSWLVDSEVKEQLMLVGEYREKGAVANKTIGIRGEALYDDADSCREAYLSLSNIELSKDALEEAQSEEKNLPF